MDAPNILDLTGAIYDAPLIGDWRPALEMIHDALECTHAVLLTHDTRSGQQIVVAGRDRGIESKYIDQYMPLNDGWPALACQEIGRAVLDRETLDMKRWQSGVFFNEFARANGLVTQAGVILSREAGVISGLVVSHGERTIEHERRDIKMLSLLWPHLQRAQLLWRKCSSVADDVSLWNGVDSFSTGIMIINHAGKILRTNRAGSEVLRCRQTDLLERRPFAGPDTLHSAILLALLRSLASEGCRQGKGCHAVHAGDQSYMLTILPLQGPPDWLGTRQTCYLLLVADLRSAPVNAMNVLLSGFGLTKAEARLAVRIGNEGSLVDIAESLGIQLSTAKTLLGRALAKTETHSQPQLVRLIERLAPP